MKSWKAKFGILIKVHLIVESYIPNDKIFVIKYLFLINLLDDKQ